MKKLILPCLLSAATLCVSAQTYSHTVQAEALNRGVVAVNSGSGILVSWRSLVSDPVDMAFDVYRDGVKINSNPITRVTNYLDKDGASGAVYEVKCLVGESVVDSGSAEAWESIYKRVHLNRPEGGTSPSGGKEVLETLDYTYTPDDVSVGDVDGDGEYELFVKWFPSNAADNSHRRHTGPTIIDCYKLDGTQLWRINLGINIRSGNHYTQFQVFDFDGDGKAELICKTAPGTVDGKGNYVVMGSDDPTADYRTSSGSNAGIILSGPEYLTVFDGATGAEISTIAYNPPRSILSSSAWGDSYGNRCERYLSGVAYLDGENPTAVFCRGYYTAAYLWAVDFDGKKLTERWLHASTTKGAGAYGEGAHSLTIGDVDGDGFDEIVYGGATIDHDGSLLYRTGTGHGDALHLAQMIPSRQGLQVFMPHEETSSSYKWDAELRDARTGEILYGNAQSGADNGRGLAANITSKTPGYEYWSSVHRVAQNMGEDVGTAKPSINFRIYWDGDLLDELLDGTDITKPNDAMSSMKTLSALASYTSVTSCNTTKKTPNLQADILGDWREEVILHDGNTESDLVIFCTPYTTDYKVTCLMQDRQYREAIAWQNVAYNQPPHLSYNLEEKFNTSASIVITSGSSNQIVNLGESMAEISFTVENAASAELISGPSWLTCTVNGNTGTLSGTPDAEGEYEYLVRTVNPDDGETVGELSGTLVVRRSEALVPMAVFSFESAGSSTPNDVYGEALAYEGDASVVTDGKKGNALSLGGSNYLVQEPYEKLSFGNKDFSIEMWIRSTDDAAYILHKGSIAADSSTGATGNWVGIELKNSTLKFAIDDDDVKSGLDISDADKWFDGEWHQIVFVRDVLAKQLFAYVDGQLVGEGEDNTGAVNCDAENLVIGNVNVNFNNAFKGDIDELTIYSGAMTASKVLEHYNTIGNELAYYKFDQLGESTPNEVFGEAKVVGEGLKLVQGVKGNAIEFNDDAYLSQDAYEAVQMGEKDFTIEFWMHSTDSDGYLFFKGSHAADSSAGTTGNWIGIERKNGYLTFTIDDDVKKTDCKLDDADYAFDGKWHHIAAVRDFANATMSLYIDGSLVSTVSGVTTGALNDNLEAMLIGNSDETGRQFAGVIDELHILPTALSADDVASEYALLKDAAAGIADILVDGDIAVRYTVVNAFSGIIVREGLNLDGVLSGLAPDVYILVKDTANGQETYKFVVK